MTVWFTSDQHYGHTKIIEYCGRPFSDAEHMTRELIARHNAVVGKHDTVWNIGDFALKDTLIPDILKQLNGTQILVPGNHDRCHPAHKKCKNLNDEKLKYCQYGFFTVMDHDPVALFEGDGFRVNHMPYTAGERHKERYSQYRPKDDGRWLLHGHIHQLWKVNGKQINVGVDVWDYRPVSLEELIETRNAATEYYRRCAAFDGMEM